MENEERQGENGGQHDGVDDTEDQALGERGQLDELGLESTGSHLSFLIKSRKSHLDARASPTQHDATGADYSGKILIFGRFVEDEAE
jgi:hypothetical protein